MAGRSTRSSARKESGYYAEDDDEDFEPHTEVEHDSDEFEAEPVVKKRRGRPTRRSRGNAAASGDNQPAISGGSIPYISIYSGSIASNQNASTQSITAPIETALDIPAPVALGFSNTLAHPDFPAAPTIPDYALPEPGLYSHYNVPEGEEARLAEYIRTLPASTAELPAINGCDICDEPFTNESPIFLPCGHIYGNNCACLLDVCPTSRCTASVYHGCGHPVRFRPAYQWQKWIHQINKVPEKCVECTVKDIDRGINIRGYKTSDLLSKIAELEAHRNQLMTMGATGPYYQEAAAIGQKLFTTRQNLQWVEKLVAEIYMAAEVYGL